MQMQLRANKKNFSSNAEHPLDLALPINTISARTNKTQTSLLLNTKFNGARAIVNVSVLFSNKSLPSSPCANRTSNSVTRRAMTMRSSMSASCLPTQPYGPGNVKLHEWSKWGEEELGEERGRGRKRYLLKTAQRQIYRGLVLGLRTSARGWTPLHFRSTTPLPSVSAPTTPKE